VNRTLQEEMMKNTKDFELCVLRQLITLEDVTFCECMNTYGSVADLLVLSHI